MSLRNLLVIATLLFISAPAAQAAEVDIGSQFGCNDGTLSFKGEALTQAAALKKIAGKIRGLKRKLATATGKKASRLKAKLKLLRDTKASIKQCLPGVALAPQVLKTLAGSYTGTWTNQTFNVTGPITVEFGMNGTKLTGNIDIGGLVFGSFDPAPIVFEQEVGGTALPFSFDLHATSLGELNITFGSDGGFSVHETLIPGISLESADLIANFANQKFSGTFRSFVLGSTEFAHGVIAVAR